MIFNTWTFALFLLAFFLIYWLVVPKRFRPTALLVSGLIFYTYHYPGHTILIVLLSLAVYGIGWAMDHTSRQGAKKLWLTAGIALCLAVLAYYKYIKLFIATVNDFFHATQLDFWFAIPEILVPLGLSFFVFEFIHYLVDLYRGIAKETSLLKFGVFALFFPTLVAGPIKRYEPFLDQLENLPSFRWNFLFEGVGRILIGIGKKVIIADSMDPFITPFQNAGQATDLELWIAIYAYSLKIFFDFSGYTDIALGTSKLLGFDILENFNYPYLKTNIAEFWRNWHISLSSWIRDYLYIPLGGNRGKKWRVVANNLLAMGLCGLWHGAAWNFVVWGLYHGVGLAVYRAFHNWRGHWWQPRPKGERPGLPGALLGIFLTFHFVAIGWIFFVNNLHDSFYILGRILQFY